MLSLTLCCVIISAFADNESATVFDVSAVTNSIAANSADKANCNNNLRCSMSQTTQFYAARNFAPIWINNDGTISKYALRVIKILNNSYQEGLNPADYHTTELNEMVSRIDVNDAIGTVPEKLLANFDMTLTDAYLLYSKHVELGRVDPSIYPKWSVDRRSANVLAQFQAAIKTGTVVENLSQIIPQSKLYAKLRDELAIYLAAAANGGWRTIPMGGDLHVGQTNHRIKLVEERLAATDEYDLPANNGYFNLELKQAILNFQKNNNLKASGVIDNATLQSLNIPVMQRIKVIELNMDRMRWLPNNLGSRYVWVNIPTYSLQVYANESQVMTMPVIVGGGGENKTCVMNSRITSLEANPYWGIPRRIATKEYLTKIQKDPEYLANHDIKIYDNQTKEAIDPADIDWSDVNQDNFNYTLRQDPGDKNALGKLKFLFSNDCGIYLHDTSNRGLFSKASRSLSHGCVRVGNPTGLANYLIANNTNSWDSKKLADTIKSGTHAGVPISNPINIHVTYLTAWVDANDNLQFRKDIYGIDAINFPVYIPTLKDLEANHE